MMWRRMVLPVARAVLLPQMVPVVRVRLNAIVARASQAALALNFPLLILSPRSGQGPDLHVCVVDTVVDAASAWPLSAWADEFRGLSSGRVAA